MAKNKTKIFASIRDASDIWQAGYISLLSVILPTGYISFQPDIHITGHSLDLLDIRSAGYNFLDIRLQIQYPIVAGCPMLRRCQISGGPDTETLLSIASLASI